MKQLRVPSAQHLARNWHPSPNGVKRDLLRLFDNSPTFNYAPVFSAVRGVMLFGEDPAQIKQGFRNRESRSHVLTSYDQIIDLLHAEVCGQDLHGVMDVQKRYFAIGQGLRIPFKPPVSYYRGAELMLPWYSMWKHNPLSGDRLRLFGELHARTREGDPDLEDAVCEIWDFSAPRGAGERSLDVVDMTGIRRLQDAEFAEMLEVFVEGFNQAQREIASRDVRKDEERRTHDPAQRDFDFL